MRASNLAFADGSRWDALISAPLVKIPTSQATQAAGEERWRFSSRPVDVSEQPAEKQKVQHAFMELCHHIWFRIKSSHVEVDQSRPTGSGGHRAWANTTYDSNAKSEGVTIHLAWELLEPLLNPDLNPAGRLLTNIHAAATLLHEIAVRFNQREPCKFNLMNISTR